MFRRSSWFLLSKERMKQKVRKAANFSEDGSTFKFPKPDENMSIVTAYKIFGFTIEDRITAHEIKKRFHRLAKVHHPDSGGSPENFKHLKEAQRLLMAVKHEAPRGSTGEEEEEDGEGKTGKRRGSTTFTRANAGDATGNVDARNREDHPNNTTDVTEAFGVMIVFPCFVIWYYYHNQRNVYRLSDGRSRMSVEEMRPHTAHPEAPEKEWHPWRASNGEREHITAIIEERKQRLGIKEEIEQKGHPVYQTTVFAIIDENKKEIRKKNMVGVNPFSSDSSINGSATGAAGSGPDAPVTAAVATGPRLNPYAAHKGGAAVPFATPINKDSPAATASISS